MLSNVRIVKITALLVIAGLMYLVSESVSQAAEIKGKVTAVEGTVARIAADGDLVPNVGDPVEIYFQIPGLEDSVEVGTGKVTEVGPQLISATITSTKAKLTKNQLARFTSSAPRKRGETVPMPPTVTTGTSGTTPPPTKPQLPPPGNVSNPSDLRGHQSAIAGLAFTPDGRHALSSAEDIREWDLATGAMLKKLPMEINSLCASFSPDGRRALTGGDKGLLRLWDMQTGKEIRRFAGHTTQIRGVAFSRDGRLIASCAGNNYIPLQPAAGEPVDAAPKEVVEDCAVRVWDVESGRELHRLDGHSGPVDSVVFSPNGLYVLSASEDFTIRLWDLRTNSQAQQFTEAEPKAMREAALSPDALTIVSCSNGIHPLTESPTGENSSPPVGPPPIDAPPVEASPAEPSPSDALPGAPVPGACQLSDAGSNYPHYEFGAFRLVLWSQATGKEIRELKGHQGDIVCALFSPDGRRVLSGSDDHTARLWDVQSGAELAAFKHTAGVCRVAFSPDGRTALTGDYDGTIHVWKLPN